MNMKLIDKVTFVLWIMNIIGIIAVPFLMIFYSNEVINLTIYLTLFYIIWTPIAILWIYNLYFFFVYDRYSPDIIFLFFFNAFYSPIYYYKVKIKKRQLRNKIDSEKAESVFDKLVVEEEIEDVNN